MHRARNLHISSTNAEDEKWDSLPLSEHLTLGKYIEKYIPRLLDFFRLDEILNDQIINYPILFKVKI